MCLLLPRTIKIRLATLLDTPGVEKLVSTLMPCKSILEDLKQYNEARRDPVSTCHFQTGFLSPCFGTIMSHVGSIPKFSWALLENWVVGSNRDGVGSGEGEKKQGNWDLKKFGAVFLTSGPMGADQICPKSLSWA